MEKLLNIKYGCIHGTYWMYFGISASFASAFLLAKGYSNAEIGLILAVGNILAVFLQPLIADLADRSKKLSLIGVTQLSGMLLMVLTLLLFILQRKSAALWVVYVLIMGLPYDIYSNILLGTIVEKLFPIFKRISASRYFFPISP